MNRDLYKYPFYKEKAADWMCPTCKKGYLHLVKDSFKVLERRDSREAFFSHPNWEPDWTRNIYSCILQCNNDQCKEVVSSSGTGGVDIDDFYGSNGEPERVLTDFYKPKFFEPPLAIIDIPSDCPTSVAQPLQESFRLFFCSPSSASNYVRVAIETLLTELGVPTQSNKLKSLTLHTRLEHLTKEYSHFKELLEAIKWLGNAGSHPGSTITIDDVMDAYEIIDHILQELYTQTAKKAKALAEKMTNSFKPQQPPGDIKSDVTQ